MKAKLEALGVWLSATFATAAEKVASASAVRVAVVAVLMLALGCLCVGCVGGCLMSR